MKYEETSRLTKNRTIARERREQMLRLGTGPHELVRCLRESRVRLIAAKAKADNLPKGAEQEVQFVAGLPPKAMDVVRSWFRINAEFDDEPSSLVALEQVSLPLDKAGGHEVRAAWRAIFNAFIQEDCPAEVTAFLEGAQPALAGSGHGSGAHIEVTSDDADECLSIAKGGSYPVNGGRILPTAVAGIISAIGGDQIDAGERREALAQSSGAVARTLGQVVSILLEKHGDAAAKKGLEIRKATVLAINEDDDPHAHPFVGFVKRVLPSGQVFVRPAALVVGEEVRELTLAQAELLFPSSGDATAFSATVTEPCKEGEVWLWTAEHRNSDKSTQCVITEQASRVYEVVAVPHSSEEPDKVREWLQASYKRDEAFPVFRLSDGLLVRVPGDPVDPGKHNFDHPLQGYWNHRAFQLQSGRVFVTDRFPAPDVKYDCAPATTWIKKLLKLRSDAAEFPAYTKAQVQALVEFARIGADEPTTQSYFRASARLQAACANRSVVEELLEELMQLPEVKASVEAEKKRALEAHEATLASRRAEIAGLEERGKELLREHEKQKKTAQAEVDRLRKATRQQESELESRIKETFERATQDGMDTLARASLLRAIVAGGRAAEVSGGRNGETVPMPAAAPAAPPWLSIGIELQGVRALKRSVRERASRNGLSEDLLSSVVAAARASAVLGLLGTRARSVAAALADLVAGGVACEVSVTSDMFGIGDLLNAPALVRSRGQQWPTTLGDFLHVRQSVGSACVVELQGANRAPPECFLPELLAMRLDASPAPAALWADRAGVARHAPVTAPVVFVLSFVAGKSTFQIPGPLSSEIPILQVDSGWADEEPPDPGAADERCLASTATWLSLLQPAQDAADGEVAPGTSVGRMRLAALGLGMSSSHADAMAFVSFNVGRMAEKEILVRVGRDAPDLSAYASAITGGAARRMLGHVVHSDQEDQKDET